MNLKNIYKSIVDEKVKDDQGKYTRHAIGEFKTDEGESHWVQDKLLKNFDKDATYVLNRLMVIVLEYGKVVGGVMTVKQY